MTNPTDDVAEKWVDKLKDFPEGDHNDQTDAYSGIFDKPPRWLRRGYRVPLYLLQCLIFGALFTTAPFLAGAGFLGALELVRNGDTTLLQVVGIWIIGIYSIGGIVLFGVGFGASLSSMINATKRLIKLFRGQT